MISKVFIWNGSQLFAIKYNITFSVWLAWNKIYTYLDLQLNGQMQYMQNGDQIDSLSALSLLADKVIGGIEKTEGQSVMYILR